MKKTAMLGLGLILMAASARASNTGFRLTYPLVFASGTNNNWISLPYFYFPNGNIGQFGQNSIDMCRDMNSAFPSTKNVAQIIRFDTATDRAKQQSCGTPIKAFDLKAGEGYSVKPSGPGVTLEILGSHDDSYAPNKTSSPTLYPLVFGTGTNNNWISVPYHAKARNSLDLCVELNPGFPSTAGVSQIFRYDTAKDQAKQQSCGNSVKAFDLVPGEGYSVKPVSAGISIGISVF